jgi:hypothetical protein
MRRAISTAGGSWASYAGGELLTPVGRRSASQSVWATHSSIRQALLNSIIDHFLFLKAPAVIVWFPLTSIAHTSNPCRPDSRASTNSGGTVTLIGEGGSAAGRVT